jgi:hypothetical protein
MAPPGSPQKVFLNDKKLFRQNTKSRPWPEILGGFSLV